MPACLPSFGGTGCLFVALRIDPLIYLILFTLRAALSESKGDTLTTCPAGQVVLLLPPLAVDFIFYPFEIRQFMTISEKIHNSANHKRFTHYKEDLFYKCYNEDTVVFVKNIREYKVSKKFVKSVAEDLNSVGFPVSEFETGSLSLANISEKIAEKGFEDNEGIIVFSLNDMGTKKDHEAWLKTIKEGYIGLVKDPATLHQQSTYANEIISMIKNYNLANSTHCWHKLAT